MDNTNNNALNGIVDTTLEKIKGLVDVNTIIGEPIRPDERTTIVPVSKVSFGFASGGSEFNAKKPEGKNNFGGGSGAGVTITPIAFLVVQGDNVHVTPVVAGNQPVDRVASLVPELIDKVSALIQKSKAEKAAKKNGTPAPTDGVSDVAAAE
ncbi:MAG: GerW family sporulation protein [Clostridia bacterium]|nr:GerW family sporulation protein [Clostridia bacterium]